METAELIAFVRRHPRLLVLTGAGLSTASGIPAYRDHTGQWRRSAPIQHRDFLASHAARQRYWSRSLVGWRTLAGAEPNRGHHALAALEALGRVELLVTQNVDGLHQRAGSRNAVDLHGRVDRVVCLSCGELSSRAALQTRLERDNPALVDFVAAAGPDGDADVDGLDLRGVMVPECGRCGGTLKPDVVFFGDSVPGARVEDAMAALARADALLVVGSSLMVYSGYRFCRRAVQLGKPQAALNRGTTRADDLFDCKVEGDCGEQLSVLLSALAEAG